MLAVATAAYLAAVYLAADAVRIGRPELADAFRTRALVMAVVAGRAGARGPRSRSQRRARPIWDGLTSGAGLAAVIVSALAGVGDGRVRRAAALRARARDGRARRRGDRRGLGARAAPQFLPGLTIEQAAAGRSVLSRRSSRWRSER